MVTPDPNATIGAIPWYKSPVQISQVTALVSAVIAMFPKLGQMLGLATPSDVSTAVTTFFAFIAIGAPLVGSFLRAKSTAQPLTLTQAGADVHPATLAVEKSAEAGTASITAKTTYAPAPNPKAKP